jgi:hypothetical protein
LAKVAFHLVSSFSGVKANILKPFTPLLSRDLQCKSLTFADRSNFSLAHLNSSSGHEIKKLEEVAQRSLEIRINRLSLME